MDRDLAELVTGDRAPRDWPRRRAPAIAEPGHAQPDAGGRLENSAAEPGSAAAPVAEDRAPNEEEVRAGSEDDPYLAPAMRAAAAAKARAARIRSAQYAPEPLTAPAWTPSHWVPPTPAAAPPNPGRSVAHAAAASPIAFRPLRRAATQPPYLTEYRPLAPEAAATPAPEPVAVATGPAVTSTAPREAQTSAGRFAKTVAELRRNRTGGPPAEPWAQMVPRPAGPRRDEPPAEAGSDARSNSFGLLWRYVRRSESGSGSAG